MIRDYFVDLSCYDCSREHLLSFDFNLIETCVDRFNGGSNCMGWRFIINYSNDLIYKDDLRNLRNKYLCIRINSDSKVISLDILSMSRYRYSIRDSLDMVTMDRLLNDMIELSIYSG